MTWDPGPMVAALEKATGKLLERAEAGVKDACDYVLAEAVNIVPLEEGTLSNSGRAKVVVEEGKITGAVGFGEGASAAYAARQHYDLSLKHNSGRTALFLEKPLMASRTEVPAIISRKVSL